MESNRVGEKDAPDEELIKEVYAQYGLSMYLSQVFETELINILTALETSKSGMPTKQTFDDLYSKHEDLTFGNLIIALTAHQIIPDDLMEEIRKLKSDRDYLAHRYFRDHDLSFMTAAGCRSMIATLEEHRQRFHALDQRVSEFEAPVFAKLGIDPEQFEKNVELKTEELLEEARSLYGHSGVDED